MLGSFDLTGIFLVIIKLSIFHFNHDFIAHDFQLHTIFSKKSFAHVNKGKYSINRFIENTCI